MLGIRFPSFYDFEQKCLHSVRIGFDSICDLFLEMVSEWSMMARDVGRFVSEAGWKRFVCSCCLNR